jgi:hypothetical protein
MKIYSFGCSFSADFQEHIVRVNATWHGICISGHLNTSHFSILLILITTDEWQENKLLGH